MFVCSAKRRMNKTSANVNDCNLFFSVQILQKSHIVPKPCHFSGSFRYIKKSHTCEHANTVSMRVAKCLAFPKSGQVFFVTVWRMRERVCASVFIRDICLTTAGQTILIYDLLVFSFV